MSPRELEIARLLVAQPWWPVASLWAGPTVTDPETLKPVPDLTSWITVGLLLGMMDSEGPTPMIFTGLYGRWDCLGRAQTDKGIGPAAESLNEESPGVAVAATVLRSRGVAVSPPSP